MPPSPESFHEVQRLPARRTAVALAVPPCAMLVIVLWQVMLGPRWGKYSISNGSIVGWTIFLWILYFRLITVRVVTDIRDHKLIVALRGLWRARRVPASDISSVEAITFNPERDYGGYGIRSIRNGTAYLAGGNQGVRVHLKNGSLLIISSQQPARFVEVLLHMITDGS